MPTVNGTLAVRLEPHGYYVIDIATGIALTGPFARQDYARGVAESLATKHGVKAVAPSTSVRGETNRSGDDAC